MPEAEPSPLILLSRDLRNELVAHAVDAYPMECFGAIVGEVVGEFRRVFEVRPLTNGATSAAISYEAIPDEIYHLLQAEQAGGHKLLGFYHSHPEVPAEPSSIDLAEAHPWYIYLICSVHKGSFDHLKGWVLDDNEIKFDEIRIALLADGG